MLVYQWQKRSYQFIQLLVNNFHSIYIEIFFFEFDLFPFKLLWTTVPWSIWHKLNVFSVGDKTIPWLINFIFYFRVNDSFNKITHAGIFYDDIRYNLLFSLLFFSSCFDDTIAHVKFSREMKISNDNSLIQFNYI